MQSASRIVIDACDGEHCCIPLENYNFKGLVFSLRVTITILLVDCKRLEDFMVERVDSLTSQGGHSLQSTSRIVIIWWMGVYSNVSNVVFTVINITLFVICDTKIDKNFIIHY